MVSRPFGSKNKEPANYTLCTQPLEEAGGLGNCRLPRLPTERPRTRPRSLLPGACLMLRTAHKAQ